MDLERKMNTFRLRKGDEHSAHASVYDQRRVAGRLDLYVTVGLWTNV